MNLCTRTNNRLESFFSKLKSCVTRRGSLKHLISGLMTVISTLRNERRHRLIQAITRVSTIAEATDDEENFRKILTPFAFNLVKKQYNSTEHLTVINSTSVQSRGGVKQVLNQNCDCPFFTSMALPCKHIFALRKHNDEMLFCPEVVNERWLMEYYSTYRPTTPRRPSCVSQATPRKIPLTERHKYTDIILITQQINVLLSRSGTQKYMARKVAGNFKSLERRQGFYGDRASP